MAFPLLRWLQRLPGDLHVTDPKRLLPAILLCAFAIALFGGLARWTIGGERRLGFSH